MKNVIYQKTFNNSKRKKSPTSNCSSGSLVTTSKSFSLREIRISDTIFFVRNVASNPVPLRFLLFLAREQL